MDERSVQQRSRPRPYDLRRKVLLKNFLREQMTHIPLPPPRLPMEEDENEVSSTVGNEENIEQSSNIQEKPSNNKQENASPAPLSEPVPSTSTSQFTSEEISPDSSTSQQTEMEVDKSTQPTFTRLSNLLRLKINSVRSRRKKITKAKLKMKAAKSPSQHSAALRAADPKGKSKSFFTMFKTRRGKRNIKSPIRISSPVSKSSSTSTSNQSCQTDVSFTQDEFSNMEQSNRCLREENRLLSESLSSFMSDFDLKLSPLKIPYGTDSYITSAGSSEAPSASHQTSPDIAKRLDYTDNASRNKIARSKSMQDRFDKRFPNRSRCLRTRSMNYGLSKRFYDSASLPQRGPHPYRRNFSPPETSNNFNNARRGKHRPNSFSSFDSSPNRIPMPEPVSRMSPHRPSVLTNLPINNSSRAIVRRSSMPERTSYQPSRPILRHKSTRVNGYNQRNVYDNGHNYNVVNGGNVPIRRRSNSNGDYGRPVPFQSLPPEAFY